eukprot:111828-Chlamydomonas_euryale.AAC.1
MGRQQAAEQTLAMPRRRARRPRAPFLRVDGLTVRSATALQCLGIVRARRRRYCQFVRAATAHDSQSPLEETAVRKAAAAHVAAVRGVWRGLRYDNKRLE